MSIHEIEARLVGPGGPFETESTVVLGEPTEVFKSRATSLRSRAIRMAALVGSRA